MKNFLKSVTRWLGVTKLMNTPRTYIGKSLTYYYSNKGKIVYDFESDRTRRDPRGVALIKEIKGETEMLLTDPEAYLLYEIVKKTTKIEGDVAEVGVYRGGSAKLIREATPKPMHLFDTWEGLPELSLKDNPEQFRKGSFNVSLKSVQAYLGSYRDIYFHKGFFPASAEPVKNKKFSFVHLDVDIYQSTYACLKFFYPRMSRGGCIVSHDYPFGSDGVKYAIDEFFKDKPEIIVEPFATDQALIVKI